MLSTNSEQTQVDEYRNVRVIPDAIPLKYFSSLPNRVLKGNTGKHMPDNNYLLLSVGMEILYLIKFICKNYSTYTYKPCSKHRMLILLRVLIFCLFVLVAEGGNL